MQNNNKWWGDFEFSNNEIISWKIGERQIAIKRCNFEWMVWNIETQNELNIPIQIQTNINEDEINSDVYSRHVLDKDIQSLSIEPSLADRAMIARPSVPLSIMPGQTIKMYISTPIWFTALLQNKSLPVFDVPFWRPSDTWFGPNTLTGDLCYSKYTDAKINFDKLEKNSNRAITVISIKNNDKAALKVERINIPVPLLRLYCDSENKLWTDKINIIQKTERGHPVSELRHSAPDNVAELTLVADSRITSSKESILASIKNLVS